MSKQRDKHWGVVINEEADKAQKRGIPYFTGHMWVEYDAAMAYRNSKKPSYTKGLFYYRPSTLSYRHKFNSVTTKQLNRKRWK